MKIQTRISLFFMIIALIMGNCLFADGKSPQQKDSPYGICAHLGGGEEHNQMPVNLQKMYDAGIRWVRADFTWSYFEHPQGQWRFDQYDRVMEQAEQQGLCILPILDYSVPWAKLAYKHPELWTEYVRQVVTRYKDRIQYWEVWNEQNLEGFWKEKPDPANYTTLLKITCQTIKKIDPKLQVVYGGLAGVPHSFFEDTLKAGAGTCFDIINIHPYRGGLINQRTNQKFIDDIEKFNQLLVQYNLPKRPIWITEMGWTTPPDFKASDTDTVSATIKIVAPNQTSVTVGYLYDTRYEQSEVYPSLYMEEMIPDSHKKKALSLDDIKTLNVKEVPFLLLPPGEVFPTPLFDDLVRYVKEGGTLILMGGVPFYYGTEMQDGFLKKAGHEAGESWRERMRIAWFAWWTRKETPKEAPVQLTDEVAKLFPHVNKGVKGMRFFEDRLLKEGDRMITLLTAKKDTFSAPVAVLYRFNSDWKGNITVNSLSALGYSTNTSTVVNQGVFLPQSYLIAFAAGIERFFWYEFQATEIDPNEREHFFGIVHKDLTPKPGYLAYRALTQARPSGSVQEPGWKKGEYCLVSWKRPDGQKGWAVWCPSGEKHIKLQISGKIQKAFDYLGKPVKLDNDNMLLTISPKILYIIGPDSIRLPEK